MSHVMMVGHRGAAGEAPENTLAAVAAAIAAGVDAVEIDVRLSRDGVPFVIHDRTLERTAGIAREPGGMSSIELRAVNSGTPHSIPTLYDILDIVAGRCAVFCELKSDIPPDGHRPLVAAAVDAIRRHGAEPWTALHSFDLRLVAQAREVCPEICAALITPGALPGNTDALITTALRVGAQALSVAHQAIGEDFVYRARRRHLMVWAWTPDSAADWDRLIAAGVDGIITNVPTTFAGHRSAGGTPR